MHEVQGKGNIIIICSSGFGAFQKWVNVESMLVAVSNLVRHPIRPEFGLIVPQNNQKNMVTFAVSEAFNHFLYIDFKYC